MRLIDAEQFDVVAYKGESNDFDRGVMFVLEKIDDVPTVDAVPTSIVEQIKWERDTAINQLAEYGIGFAENKKDLIEVVRCRDCHKYNLRIINQKDGWCMRSNAYAKDDDFCSYGERREHEDI